MTTTPKKEVQTVARELGPEVDSSALLSVLTAGENPILKPGSKLRTHVDPELAKAAWAKAQAAQAETAPAQPQASDAPPPGGAYEPDDRVQIPTLALSLGLDAHEALKFAKLHGLVPPDWVVTNVVSESAFRAAWTEFLSQSPQPPAVPTTISGWARANSTRAAPYVEWVIHQGLAPADTTDDTELPEAIIDQLPAPVTVGQVVEEFRKRGYSELTVEDVGKLIPGLRFRSRIKMKARHIPPILMPYVNNVLVFLLTARIRLNRDKRNLKDWKAPRLEDIEGQEILRYMGICGHVVTLTSQEHLKRRRHWEEGNPLYPVLPRLCESCGLKRVELMGNCPEAANSDSICRVCELPTFSAANTLQALQNSRRDIWENLISGIYELLDLPKRLNPDHGSRHPRHKELMAERHRELEQWKERFRLRVDIEASARPDKARALKAGMESRIRDKQIELGLEEAEED